MDDQAVGIALWVVLLTHSDQTCAEKKGFQQNSGDRSHYYRHTPDYDSVFNSEHEYRIEGTNVFARLLEDKVEHYTDVEYRVKDNVVLEV